MLRIHSLGALCLVLVLAGGCRREGTPRGDASLSRDAAQMDADAGRSGDGGGDIDAGDDGGVVDGDGGAMDGGAMDGSMADGGVTDGGVDGGPVSMPEDAQYVLDNTKTCHGFYGASSMERLPTEVALTKQTEAFKALSLS